ncbi:MAG: hypothetical protein ABIJ91_02000 [Candidatus Kuenenbacteria bacterium]
MDTPKKIFFLIIFIVFAGSLFLNLPTTQANEKLPIYFFWGDGCPHCHDEQIFLEKIKKDYPEIEILDFEVWNNKKNQKFFLKMGNDLTGRPFRGVPATVIGDEYVVGYGSDDITGAQIKHLLNIYLINSCQDKTHNHSEFPEEEEQCDETPTSTFEQIVNYPLFGKINLKSLSLPALTAVLGTLDGFNPCSMWALLMLITLLINTGSRKKMWVVGATFILVSALSYFVFLTAWMNVFMLIGYLKITRIIIGILAITVSIYFLRDFWKKRKQSDVVCEVGSDRHKEKIVARLQNVLQYDKLIPIIIGVAFIAFSVNLIELFCSAGLPTIFTGILAQNELPKTSYYLYLLGYDFFYMLDDIVILLIAGFTFQAFQGSAKFTKYSHLIGGILILVLGLIMLINPNLLMMG